MSTDWLYLEENLNGNSTSTVSNIIDLKGIENGSFFIKEKTGNLSGMILTFEFANTSSPSSGDWYSSIWNSSGNFTWQVGPFTGGQNEIIQGNSFSIDYMRVKVTTASLTLSTFDIILVGK